ncbi:phosphotransferase [Clostridium subterminale]|uniref:Phosphotransferase n=1 Tax=Clostridium subterminale TaxID=1550 RepID=A0ABP3VQK3_CLOSU
MTRKEQCSKINEAIENINFSGKYIEHTLYGSGHINDTFLVKFEQNNGEIKKYILQRINHNIFKNPLKVMENISGVTSFLKYKIKESGGDTERETLNIIKTKDGNNFFKDSIGSYWRGYKFIENATSFDKVEKPEIFYESALTFGYFQNLLSEYDVSTLYETIPDFHNTPVRVESFKIAIAEDKFQRVKKVEKEIEFVMEREKETHILIDMLRRGMLHLRVTHNDTKLNNIMMDNESGKGICIIDLDTIMPGLSVNDFGDSIRFGANTGDEDEIDLSKVNLDMNLFEIYTRGFLEGCKGSLVDNEIDMLPMGAKMMTLECGIRFLTDYLNGDNYFKIHRPDHNLDRARAQFKLVYDMEKKWMDMKKVIENYRNILK